MIVLHRVGNAEPAIVRYRRPTAQEAAPGLDLVAIERALGGEYPPAPLTDPEARLAGRLIVDPDGEIRAAEIAHLLGVHSRTVVRWRAERRAEPTEGGTTMNTTVKRGERWQDHAACLDIDPRLFFPDGEVGSAAKALYRDAVRICAGCPVIKQCLRTALAAEGATPSKSRSGVFGGKTPAERDAIYRRQQAAGRSELAA
ncbi:WhiB family transcriptional regulator [Kitasatospora indigofera]|uniref:WhiB family transcriptional regulator n=1 Tax=Kitasatospora indigofera TaxID=67307 RepID=UPI00369EC5E1